MTILDSSYRFGQQSRPELLFIFLTFHQMSISSGTLGKRTRHALTFMGPNQRRSPSTAHFAVPETDMPKSSLLYIWRRLLRVAPLAIGMLVLFMGKPAAAGPVNVGGLLQWRFCLCSRKLAAWVFGRQLYACCVVHLVRSDKRELHALGTYGGASSTNSGLFEVLLMSGLGSSSTVFESATFVNSPPGSVALGPVSLAPGTYYLMAESKTNIVNSVYWIVASQITVQDRGAVGLGFSSADGGSTWFEGHPFEFDVLGTSSSNAPVPEPSSLLLFGIGLLSLFPAIRRSRT